LCVQSNKVEMIFLIILLYHWFGTYIVVEDLYFFLMDESMVIDKINIILVSKNREYIDLRISMNLRRNGC